MSETFDLILETARRLFQERGYSATSVREIAEACGIAKATVYHHFPDKERILLTLLEGGQSDQDAMIARLTAEGDPRLRIEKAVGESLGFLSANMTLMQAARRETVSGRDLVRKRFLPGIGRLKGLLLEAIDAGIASGAFRAVEPEAAASVLIAMIQGSYAGALLSDGKGGAPEAMVPAILEIYFDGISAAKVREK